MYGVVHIGDNIVSDAGQARSLSAEKEALAGSLERNIAIVSQFTRPRRTVCRDAVLKVVLHWTDNIADPQYAVSSDALRRLEEFTDARGRRLKV